MIIRSSRVVLDDGVQAADLHIDNGTIVRIDRRPHPGSVVSAALVDVGDLLVSPGLVDTHVHVNEPGRTTWEGFDTATRAAAAGGVTTIVDMPLNCVPATTSVDALELKRASARGRSHVDVAFWGGVVPGNASALDALVDAGVRGFKCFLVPSGVDEFRPVGEADLHAALPVLARRDVPLLVHAEAPEAICEPVGSRADLYATYLATRPPEAEVRAIRAIAALGRSYHVPVHIVHVASADAVDAIARAKQDGGRLTAETCPHYLTFAAGEIPDGATEWKCAPPIREARHRDALRTALRQGALDVVATDHSPSPPSLKCPGDFLRAWGGIASLELSLAATWTSLTAEASPDECESVAVAIGRWMSAAPASLARLARKGRLAEGYDADLVIWDPDAEWTVERSRLQQRHKVTPYARRTLHGRVVATYVRGVRVWAGDRLDGIATGQLL